jgi:hypothetical protein
MHALVVHGAELGAAAADDDGVPALAEGPAAAVLPVLPRLPHPAVKTVAAMMINKAGLMAYPSPERALAARPSRY